MNNQTLYREALKYIPGGVNSPVRAFKAVGGTPLFIRKGEGKYIYSEENRRYIDFCLSWGPLILGHSHSAVVKNLQAAIKKGSSYGAPTRAETELAKLLCENVPSLEKVRLVNSGTEAVMSALRLARGYTRRNKVLKFDGCYHGHVDAMLVNAGSGVAGLPDSSSAGVGATQIRDTLSVPYNDFESFNSVFEREKNNLACVIIEPVAGNMGVIPPLPGFLENIREKTLKNAVLLIFDEVITGYRLGLKGAQGRYGITPDLTTLGKIIGGGLPLAAFGGRADIMDMLAPGGSVYQAGTLSGNPLAVSAGLAQLRFLNAHPETYDQLEELGTKLEKSVKITSQLTLNRVGSMFTIFFTPAPVQSMKDAQKQNTNRFKRFYHGALDNGIYLPPSPFESAFLCRKHTAEDISKLIHVLKTCF